MGYIVPHILIIIGAVTVLLLIFKLIFRNPRKASVFLCLFSFLFFSYGHARYFIEDLRFFRVFGPDHILMLLSGLILVLGFFYLKRTRRELDHLILFLNLSLILLVFAGIDILQFKLRNPYQAAPAEISINDRAPSDAAVGYLPDIYYIIPDRYTSEEVLREVWQYDNSYFIDGLRERGFHVIDRARSNYHKTAQSLASSLNMRHLHYLRDELGSAHQDWRPLHDLLQNYEVLRYLKAKGYLYIHMGTWWAPTSSNPNADIDYNITSLSEFNSVFYGTTMLYPIFYRLGIRGIFDDYWKIHYQRVYFKFDQLKKIPSFQSPKFVFVHFNIPHPPYIFDRHGNFVPLQEARLRKNYTETLAFTNRKFIQMVDAIIENSPSPPVIIIQSDEGEFPVRYAKDELNFSWREATDWELKEKFEILNAIYIPDSPGDLWYESVTPVNTFRILFNHLFGEEFELLPDRSYAVSSDRYPYDFIDVTDRLLRQ